MNMIDSVSDFTVSDQSVGECSINGDDVNDSLASSQIQTRASEIDTMKSRFSKLLLGEDMSGSGKGVSSALAISNAITNLYASIFSQVWKLEPLTPEKTITWSREIEWLLSVTDHIVEMVPSDKTFPDGTKLEIMIRRPRSDLSIHLPALRKLDSILIEILNGFRDTEFWYNDTDSSSCLTNNATERRNEKWWHPVPQIPLEGLSSDTRMNLQHKRECANQILKAAMTINNQTLSDIDIPYSYLKCLPKTGRGCLGDSLYKFIDSDSNFSIGRLFDCLEFSVDNVVLEIENRLEAAIIVWSKSCQLHNVSSSRRFTPKSPLIEMERTELIKSRAEDLLQTLKQKFPYLSKTTLEAAKIHSNMDVGRSILESYSRVLETLAYNIIVRIDDLLSIDKLKSPLTAHQAVELPYSVSLTSTPTVVSPSKSEMTPFLNKLQRHGGAASRAKRVLASYLWPKNTRNEEERFIR